MKKTTILKHWDSYAECARDLGITRSAISQWPDSVPTFWAQTIKRTLQWREMLAKIARERIVDE